ncbi:polymer-forming cytoskeletal protein [Halomonas sp. CKK8]|uniref:polymer-forming cytoskeletal protein n=1 Tax=Halomonas sp. CKK8 TaxID=3036127 RepID=UPI0024159104|nr:polymer-forming cytoskeletal protein [Halomonas sp. CKK8]WFM72923.1 polymer-forming cytoskeletal protein [Halomonas sp. CKK8]
MTPTSSPRLPEVTVVAPRQRGAALITVLLLSVIGVMVSLSSMQSSLLAENLAGNYRQMTQAQALAERGQIAFLDASTQPTKSDALENALKQLSETLSPYYQKLRDQNTLNTLLCAQDSAATEKAESLIKEALLSGSPQEDISGLTFSQLRDSLKPAIKSKVESLEKVFNKQDDSIPHGSFQSHVDVVLPQQLEKLPHDCDVEDGTASGEAVTLVENKLIFFLRSEGRFGGSVEARQARRSITTLVNWNPPASTGRPVAGVDTCEGVTLGGSGIIDSYDSAQGPYGPGNRHGQEATITSQVMQDPDQAQYDPREKSYDAKEAAITLTGHSPIYGDVVSPGGVYLQGSSPVYGNIKANATVNLKGGGVNVYGNVEAGGRLWFGSSATVHGDAAASQSLEFNNWSAGISGDAMAPAINTTPKQNSNRTPEDHVGGTLSLTSPPFKPVASVASAAECDSLGFGNDDTDPVRQLQQQSLTVASKLDMGGNDRYRLTANGVEKQVAQGWQRVGISPRNVSILGRDTQAVGFSGWDFGGSSQFTIGTSDNPVDMVLYLDGDTRIGGGGNITISEGSSLTIVTTSQFDLTSGIIVGDGKPSRIVDGEARPILSLYSSFEQTDKKAGVSLSGHSDFFGQIVAPFSDLEVTGSGALFGAVNARRFEISGSGGVHLDEQLLGTAVQGGDTSSGGEPGVVVTRWRDPDR